MIKLCLQVRTDGWNYVEVITHASDMVTGAEYRPRVARVALGSEDGHLALQAAAETLLQEVQLVDEAVWSARSPG